MTLARVLLLLLGGAIYAAPAIAQPRQACLHTGLESADERQRRIEALAAMRLINSAMNRVGRLPNQQPAYPTWEGLAGAPIAPITPGLGGFIGDLARKIRWGAVEPLPGWQIHHVTSGEAYSFSLRDVRDPCGLTYYSNETGTIVEGYPDDGGRRGGITPIT